MPEKLALKKAFGDGSHVYGNHFFRTAGRKCMNFTCQHLFSRTVFSGDKDICIGYGDFLHQRAQLLHDGTFSPIHGRGYRRGIFSIILIMNGLGCIQ